MRIFLTIAANFLIPTVLGGFIFGIVMAAGITLQQNKLENMLPAMALAGMMSSIFAFFLFMFPGLAYSFLIGILSASISDPRTRKRILIGVALVAGFTLFPSFIWVRDKGFKDAWWIIALISGPLFVLTAYLVDKRLEDRPKPNKPRQSNP